MSGRGGGNEYSKSSQSSCAIHIACNPHKRTSRFGTSLLLSVLLVVALVSALPEKRHDESKTEQRPAVRHSANWAVRRPWQRPAYGEWGRGPRGAVSLPSMSQNRPNSHHTARGAAPWLQEPPIEPLNHRRHWHAARSDVSSVPSVARPWPIASSRKLYTWYPSQHWYGNGNSAQWTANQQKQIEQWNSGTRDGTTVRFQAYKDASRDAAMKNYRRYNYYYHNNNGNSYRGSQNDKYTPDKSKQQHGQYGFRPPPSSGTDNVDYHSSEVVEPMGPSNYGSIKDTPISNKNESNERPQEWKPSSATTTSTAPTTTATKVSIVVDENSSAEEDLGDGEDIDKPSQATSPLTPQEDSEEVDGIQNETNASQDVSVEEEEEADGPPVVDFPETDYGLTDGETLSGSSPKGPDNDYEYSDYFQDGENVLVQSSSNNETNSDGPVENTSNEPQVDDDYIDYDYDYSSRFPEGNLNEAETQGDEAEVFSLVSPRKMKSNGPLSVLGAESAFATNRNSRTQKNPTGTGLEKDAEGDLMDKLRPVYRPPPHVAQMMALMMTTPTETPSAELDLPEETEERRKRRSISDVDLDRIANLAELSLPQDHVQGSSQQPLPLSRINFDFVGTSDELGFEDEDGLVVLNDDGSQMTTLNDKPKRRVSGKVPLDVPEDDDSLNKTKDEDETRSTDARPVGKTDSDVKAAGMASAPVTSTKQPSEEKTTMAVTSSPAPNYSSGISQQSTIADSRSTSTSNMRKTTLGFAAEDEGNPNDNLVGQLSSSQSSAQAATGGSTAALSDATIATTESATPQRTTVTTSVTSTTAVTTKQSTTAKTTAAETKTPSTTTATATSTAKMTKPSTTATQTTESTTTSAKLMSTPTQTSTIMETSTSAKSTTAQKAETGKRETSTSTAGTTTGKEKITTSGSSSSTPGVEEEEQVDEYDNAGELFTPTSPKVPTLDEVLSSLTSIVMSSSLSSNAPSTPTLTANLQASTESTREDEETTEGGNFEDSEENDALEVELSDKDGGISSPPAQFLCPPFNKACKVVGQKSSTSAQSPPAIPVLTNGTGSSAEDFVDEGPIEEEDDYVFRTEVYASVVTRQGRVLGREVEQHLEDPGHPSYYAFLGIPYAEPPTGSLRFKPPVPHRGWTGTWNGTVTRPKCIQYDIFVELDVVGQEDCLYLNIFTPKLPTTLEDAVMPVLFYIPGGFFMTSSSDPSEALNPSAIMAEAGNMARREGDNDGVIVVTVNYRLGPLGFLSTEDNVAPGNLGLRDVALALRWVHTNIRYFGGDKDSVTVGGYGSGASLAHLLAFNPAAKELISGMVLQGGSALSTGALTKGHAQAAAKLADLLECRNSASPPLASDEKTMEQKRKKSPGSREERKAGSEDLLACLQTKDAASIVRASRRMLEWQAFPLFFTPRIDGGDVEDPVVPEDPRRSMERGDFCRVPMMTGFPKDIGLINTFTILSVPEPYLRELNANWTRLCPAALQLTDASMLDLTSPGKCRGDSSRALCRIIRKEYFGSRSIDLTTAYDLSNLMGERWFKQGIVEAAEKHSQFADTFVYVHNYEPANGFREVLFSGARKNAFNLSEDYTDGAFYGDDLMALFPRPSKKPAQYAGVQETPEILSESHHHNTRKRKRKPSAADQMGAHQLEKDVQKSSTDEKISRLFIRLVLNFLRDRLPDAGSHALKQDSSLHLLSWPKYTKSEGRYYVVDNPPRQSKSPVSPGVTKFWDFVSSITDADDEPEEK